MKKVLPWKHFYNWKFTKKKSLFLFFSFLRSEVLSSTQGLRKMRARDKTVESFDYTFLTNLVFSIHAVFVFPSTLTWNRKLNKKSITRLIEKIDILFVKKKATRYKRFLTKVQNGLEIKVKADFGNVISSRKRVRRTKEKKETHKSRAK